MVIPSLPRRTLLVLLQMTIVFAVRFAFIASLLLAIAFLSTGYRSYIGDLHVVTFAKVAACSWLTWQITACIWWIWLKRGPIQIFKWDRVERIDKTHELLPQEARAIIERTRALWQDAEFCICARGKLRFLEVSSGHDPDFSCQVFAWQP
jgi:hypothetical protein